MNNATFHPWVSALMDICDKHKAEAAERNDDCVALSGLLTAHGITEFHAYISEAMAMVIIRIAPEKLSDIAPFLRDVREWSGQALEPQPEPEQNRMYYIIPMRIMIVAELTKGCRFVKVGEETVTKPIYEISCD